MVHTHGSDCLGSFPFPDLCHGSLVTQEISLSGGRYQNCLREIRARAADFEDKEKGIKIAKEDWQKLRVHIASYNNFPTAAGLASSAAGFACLGNIDGPCSFFLLLFIINVMLNGLVIISKYPVLTIMTLDL